MATTLLAEKSPADEFSLQNRAVVHDKNSMYAKVMVPGRVQECYLTLGSHPRMEAGKLGLSGPQVSTPMFGSWGVHRDSFSGVVSDPQVATSR